MGDQQLLPDDQDLPNPLVAEDMARDEEQRREAGEFIITDKRGGKGKPPTAHVGGVEVPVDPEDPDELLRRQAEAMQEDAKNAPPERKFVTAFVIAMRHDGSYVMGQHHEVSEDDFERTATGNEMFSGVGFVQEDMRQQRVCDRLIETLAAQATMARQMQAAMGARGGQQ